MSKKIVTSLAALSLCFSFLKGYTQYCTPSAPTNCDEFITNLTLNTINNNSSGCGNVANGYSDFIAISTSLNTGQSYPVSVTLGPSYNGDTVLIWIDENHNSVFEPSEVVAKLSCYTGTTTTCSSSITVPATALAGNTRMRVKVNWTGSGIEDPCVCGAYGMAEDFTVNIVLTCSGTPTAPTINNPASAICNGSTITLTATENNSGAGIIHHWQQSASASGPWSNVIGGSGATALSYTTAALASSKYFRMVDTCTNSNLFAASTPVLITVATSPSSLLQTSNSLTICPAQNATYVALGAGGGLSYQWQVDMGSGFTNVSNGGVYSGATTNTLNITSAISAMNGYMYRMVASNVCGSANSASGTLNVLPQPLVPIGVQGPTHICDGGAVVLQTYSVAGYSYQWLLNGVNIPGAANSVYVASASGDYSVVVTNGNNCSGTSSGISVVVNAGPGPVFLVPGGPTSVCIGGNVALNSGAPSGLLYQWYDDNNLIAGAADTTYYVAVNTGTYTLKVMDSNGCSVTSNAVPVTIDTLNPMIVANGNVLCTDGSYTSYQWYYNGTAIPGATGACDTATADGDYYVIVSDSLPCNAQSANYTVSPASVLSHSKSNSIKMYPNPATSYFHIDAPSKIFVSINSLQGKTILQTNGAKDIDISSLASGMYMIQVYDEKMVLLNTQKLVKTDR